MGSGGREVAHRLADQLGLTVVLHELVEHNLAEHMQVPESTVHHRLEGGASLRERWQISGRRLARHTQEEILDLALKGNVLIRGWGACVFLRGIPHVIRVRVCAPLEVRERSVMERRGLSDKSQARKEIERNDAAHKRNLQVAFSVDRENPLLYDLVINTERTSVDAAVRLVRLLAESPEYQETEASRAILTDRALEARIRTRLRDRFGPGTGVTGADVTASGGTVVLFGTALHPTLSSDAASLVRATMGVSEVVNRIEIVRGPRVF
jgi:cytidylate kinase